MFGKWNDCFKYFILSKLPQTMCERILFQFVQDGLFILKSLSCSNIYCSHFIFFLHFISFAAQSLFRINEYVLLLLSIGWVNLIWGECWEGTRYFFLKKLGNDLSNNNSVIIPHENVRNLHRKMKMSKHFKILYY